MDITSEVNILNIYKMATRKRDSLTKSIKKNCSNDIINFEDLINNLYKFRKQTPNEHVLAILRDMLDFLKKDVSLKKDYNIEILLIVQDIVKNSFYDNPCATDILKIAKEFMNILVTKPVEFNEADFPDLTKSGTKHRGGKIPTRTEPAPPPPPPSPSNDDRITIQAVSNLVFETVVGLKEKWGCDDEENVVLKKFVEYWEKFEVRFRKSKQKDSPEILKSLYDLLSQFNFTREATQMATTETSAAVIPIIEISDKKSFKDIENEYILELMNQMTPASETAVSIPNNQECFINFNKIWCNNSRWLGLKYKLLQKGLNKLNELYLCYPIFRNEFLISEGGTFGKVEVGFSKNFHGVAVRRLTEHGISPEICTQLSKLIENLSKLTHTNLIRTCIYQDICGHTFFYNKLCEYNLHDYIKQNFNSLEKTDKKRMMYQMLKGMNALHMNNPLIVHGNLKPNNIFIDENGVVKLAEFGIYKHLNYMKNIRDDTKIWWPPEIHEWYNIMNTYNCTVMSDVYACGMCFYFINAGIHPYGDDTPEIIKNLSSGKLNLKSDQIDLDLYSLLYFMLDVDSKIRPNIVEVLNHIYFWNDERRFEFLQKIIIIFSKNRDEFKKICDQNKFITVLWSLSKFSNLHMQSGLIIDRLDDVKYYLNETSGQYGIGGSAFSEIPVLIYNLILATDWFQVHEELRKFCPNAITLEL